MGCSVARLVNRLVGDCSLVPTKSVRRFVGWSPNHGCFSSHRASGHRQDQTLRRTVLPQVTDAYFLTPSTATDLCMVAGATAGQTKVPSTQSRLAFAAGGQDAKVAAAFAKVRANVHLQLKCAEEGAGAHCIKCPAQDHTALSVQ